MALHIHLGRFAVALTAVALITLGVAVEETRYQYGFLIGGFVLFLATVLMAVQRRDARAMAVVGASLALTGTFLMAERAALYDVGAVMFTMGIVALAYVLGLRPYGAVFRSTPAMGKIALAAAGAVLVLFATLLATPTERSGGRQYYYGSILYGVGWTLMAAAAASTERFLVGA